MADNNLPADVANKPHEKVYYSSPFTRRAIELAKRVDAVMRRAEERFGRGQMGHSRYLEIQTKVNSLLESLEQGLSEFQGTRGSRRRNAGTGKSTGKSSKSKSNDNGAAATNGKSQAPASTANGEPTTGATASAAAGIATPAADEPASNEPAPAGTSSAGSSPADADNIAAESQEHDRTIPPSF